jgi:coenzyme F420-reducing hydrogenase gamma subunit
LPSIVPGRQKHTIAKHQLLEVTHALLNGRVPNLLGYSECIECKRNGSACVMVADSITCLGPVTQAGCGNPSVLKPSFPGSAVRMMKTKSKEGPTSRSRIG